MISVIVDFANSEKKAKLWKVLKTLRPKKYEIVIKQHRDNRTNPQNKYYWGCVLSILSDHTGFTIEEAHEVLKKKFLPVSKVLSTGEEITYAGSTADLNTQEFEDYLEKIRIFSATELDCYIPNPNETI